MFQLCFRVSGHISSKHWGNLFRASGLKYWENVYPSPCFIFHMSGVTYHVSNSLKCHYSPTKQATWNTKTWKKNPAYKQHLALLYVCDSGLPLLYHESKSKPLVLSITWVLSNSNYEYHEPRFFNNIKTIFFLNKNIVFKRVKKTK